MANLVNGVAGSIAKVAFGVSAGALFFDNAVYTVPPGHRAIIFDRTKGVTSVVKNEGAHLILPIIQRPIIMDCRTTPRTISSITGTKDLQSVNLSLRILSRPNTANLPELYKSLGEDYQERILPSVGNEVLKAIVARYNADQLLTLRDQVSKEIRETMVKRCEGFNLLVDDVSITHLNFSSDFAKAIEAKQVAEQNAERAKFVVAKAEQEKLALIVRSEGDSEAALLVSSALNKFGPGLIELRKIETAQQIAADLAKNPRVTYVPQGQGMLMNLPAFGNGPQSRS
jgi:prohibitin 1